MVVAEAVEDEAGRAGLRNGTDGPGVCHRYNAALKQATGDKSREHMASVKLGAAIDWLERNRLADHLHLLDDDPRHAWTSRKRRE